ncbi:MAG: GNAT family N-acetyltransferase [Chloroflexota bacterium]
MPAPAMIRPAVATDPPQLQEQFSQIGWSKPDGYFADCVRLQEEGKIVLLIAEIDGHYVGHCKVVWEPDYPYFKEQNIPETQDLNVLTQVRRQGVATQLMDESERRIGERSDLAGIGFGLYKDYGAAQRMYVLRGYVPDSQGITYNNVLATPGESYPVDDDLVLCLVKRLR